MVERGLGAFGLLVELFRGALLLRGERNVLQLFVGDHLAEGGDALFDSGDFFRPGADGVIGVGDSCGSFAFGLGEMVKEDVESLLEGRAGHELESITGDGGSGFARRMPTSQNRDMGLPI